MKAETLTYRVIAVDDSTVDITIMYGARVGETDRVRIADLEQLSMGEAGSAYAPILREARDAVWDLAAQRSHDMLQRSIDKCPGHSAHERSGERCGSDCVAREPYTYCNRAAHGGIAYVETCQCGAERRVASNQSHREVGPWGNPLR